MFWKVWLQQKIYGKNNLDDEKIEDSLTGILYVCDISHIYNVSTVPKLYILI